TVTEFPSGSAPLDITAGPDGNLWYAEASAGKFGRITTGGTVSEIGAPRPPTSPSPFWMTPGPDGNIWSGDLSAHRLYRITPLGAVATFSIPTASSGPQGIIAGPDGNLWFTEHDSNKIGRLTLLSATAAPLSVGVGSPFAGPVATFQAFDPLANSSDF